MNRKKITAIFLLICLIGISLLSVAEKGECASYSIVWYFNTDKDTYYYDEEMYINASWDLEYDNGEISFIRIKLFDDGWRLLWNSSFYFQKGTHLEGEWHVNIEDLDLPFNNTSNDLIVVFYYYLNSGDISEGNIKTKYFQAMKRNVSCELIDFRPSLVFGDKFDFIAKFYYAENDSVLTNNVINLQIKSNNKIIFNKNFTTNSSGLIYVFIPNYNLTVGKNTLLVNVMESIFHSNFTLEYQFTIFAQSQPSNSDRIISKNKDISQLISSVISIASILSVVVLFFLYAYYKKRKIPIPLKNITT